MASEKSKYEVRLQQRFAIVRSDLAKAKMVIDHDSLYENEFARGLGAHLALQIEPENPRDKIIGEAFKKAKLDPANPLHWKLLLWSFVDAHHNNRAGAPDKWNAWKYTQLLIEVARIKRKNPTLKDSAIAKELLKKKTIKEAFNGITVSTLRKLIPQTRVPANNVILQNPEIVDAMAAEFGRLIREQGIAWTPQMEEHYKREMLVLAGIQTG